MPARSIYGSYYESGSTARKRNYVETPEERNNTANRKYGKNKVKTNTKVQSASSVTKALYLTVIVIAFAMLMLMTYRFNIISEKNLVSQQLKADLESTEANLLAAKIAVEQNTNLDYIESYAKQKLGMQKPTSSQTVYVDTSNITQVVEANENLNVIESIASKIKSIFNNVF